MLFSQNYRDKIKKGLDHCANGNGCPFESDRDCEYRISDTGCDRSQLMLDAKAAIEDLESKLAEECRRLENVRKAACGPGLDDEFCSYE